VCAFAILNENLVLSEQEFEQFSKLVYTHCGIDLHDGKKELVRARLSKLIRAGNFGSFSEYYDYVIADSTGAAISELTDSISTNLTSFFREPQHFAFLTQTLVPEMLCRKTGQNTRRIRAWSAGCSSGEEPYSIAITLLEAIRNQGQWDLKILATDISRKILNRAQQGQYDDERISTIPPAVKSKYLFAKRHNGQPLYHVCPNLKEIIVFKYLNLMENWPFQGPIDFIFCRNVMIYFDKSTQQRLVNRYWQVLERGGYLFTGHSESLTGIDHKFRYIQPTIYKKD